METSYPLSPMQQGMLFHSLHEPENGVDLEQIVCTLRENLELPLFIQAWEQVIERHPILRTSFRWSDLDEPSQQVYQGIQLPLTQYDWQDIPAAEKLDRHQTYLKDDRQRGFDLAHAPLMRLALFRLADAEYRLVWTFHHILLDGRSFTLLLKEVFALYEAICQGQTVPLPTPRPYKDYIEWLQQQDRSKAKDFWQHLLKGFTTPTPLLPVQASSQLLDRVEHGEAQICLSAASTAALQSLAKQQDITPNTIVQGAWALLLSRYSGEEDVVFGATRACRHASLSGTEAMIGLLINTLPVRVQVSAEVSLLPWLKALRSQHLAVRDYEHTPLVNVQAWSEVPPGTRLFESLVVFENYSLNTTLQQQGGNWQNRDVQLHEQPGFPLVLLGCLDAELVLKISYDRRRFDQAAIARLLGHLQTLLEGMIAQPEQTLADLTLVTAAERHQLLVSWNDTAVPYAQDICLHQLFEAQVARNPDAIAVVYEHQQLTYGEVNRQANQLAHHLKTLGVGSGTFVGVYFNRGLEMIPALLGILKAGGAYVPLEPSFPDARVQWILDSLDVRWVITQPCHQPTFEGLQPQLPRLEHLICLDLACSNMNAIETVVDRVLKPSSTGLHIWQHAHLHLQPEENLPRQSSPDDTAYVIFTSGSTGTPKGVVVRHQPVINLIEWVNRTFDVTASDRVLFITSLCFDLSVYDIFGLLAAGGSIRVVSSEAVRDPAALLQILCREPITFWDSAPPALQQLVPFFTSIHATDRPNLRLVFMSGDWIPVSLPNALKAAFPGVKVISLGGATEATVWSNVYPIDQIEPSWTSIPYGKPIQNAQYYILDARLQPCPIGVTGELYIGGDCLASGYTDPVKTAERFISHSFHSSSQARLYRTGDLARFFPDGNIEFLGRIDHQVKIRGFRIELGEIEAVLAQHPAIRVSVVMAREDQPGEKRLVAYIVPRERPAPTIGELRRCLKEKLPEYMVPSAFVMLKELPVTANGKLDRQALPAPEAVFGDDRQTLLASATNAGGTDATASAFVAPRDELERQLIEVWQDVLKVKPIGIHDNFFELGGHSLSAVRVWAQVEKRLSKGLPLSTLFQAPTISELANALRQIEPAPTCPSLVVIQTGKPTNQKPPLFCIHVLGRGLEFYLPLVRHLDPALPIYGLAAQIAGEAIALDRVEAIATHYIKQMRALQSQGPYLLIGVSFGGLVAYEMAQQLKEQGQEVALLGLIDTYPLFTPQAPLVLETAAKNWHKIRQSGLLTMLKDQLHWRAHDLTEALGDLYCHVRTRFYQSVSLPLPDKVMDFNYEQENQQLANRYCIRRYSGRVTLFKATELARAHRHLPDNELSWRGLVEESLEVYFIPGDHLKMLQAPHVQTLGEKLQECLAQVTAPPVQTDLQP
ncbi:non-ribosomal peptide synthetase [Stenomitos frigidus]|uniref:Non-ribosomal peptide synthetase n=1 Tax=Stenomitos frigidus ULC18 TaxID=2107698 RepID=A0A2T1E9H1_9CYAN|nr:non-ribosomal peptide synthetase [Stenomitos frigidus]PSB29399.1 non-ribosomal peptide synthetase [Stenomitos frigidus ULC18]